MGNMYGIIAGLCEKRGIKPGKLCADLGISRGTMGDLKAGRTKQLSVENVGKIAAYFGVSTDYLLGEGTEKAPTADGGRKDILDEVDVAFYGEYKELTEDQKETVRDMVRVMRERRAKQEK